MSEIMELVTHEAFLRRVQTAVVARALTAPSGTPEEVAVRTSYNQAALRLPERSAAEARRFVVPVVMNPSVQADFGVGGMDAIAQSDIEYVVEQEILSVLGSDELTDPALAITLATEQEVILDIAGALSTLALQIVRSPAYAPTTEIGATMIGWLRLHVADRDQTVRTARRIAHLVLAEPALLRDLSIGGVSVLTASALATATATVLEAIVRLEGRRPDVMAAANAARTEATGAAS